MWLLLAPELRVTYALFTLVQAHPNWQSTCLVRNTEIKTKAATAEPKVKLVYGDLEGGECLA